MRFVSSTPIILRRRNMKAKLIAILAFAVAVGFASAAMADQFSFNGNGISASGTFTTGPSSIADAEEITSITGTFSDSNAHVSGAITGLYQPVSYVDTIPGVALTTGGLSYDDLFFPGGTSPADCLGYPFAGGQLSIFGVAFDIGGSGGYVGEIWSNGFLPDSNGTFPGTSGYVPNLVYAAGLANATDPVDNPNNVPGPNVPPPGRYGSFVATTPEPASLVLFGFGLLGVAALWMRKNDVLRSTR